MQETKVGVQVSKKELHTAHPWHDDHSTSISVYEVWGTRVKVQISKKELHTYIHLLEYVKVEFL